ncbi:MAG: sigma-54-dependent Fis family transcriptional regulator [Bacillota bacterium]|uniref:sigma-54-dependent Fis family transcriptional regulator n=1 Tax=Desulfurispora thermophila TaxID=265470 RepID=UPI00037C2608|nr:sigma 54-interacting transcriptional regulator [Desulfurispora thermophila]
MSFLGLIASTAQQVADAISAVLGVEAEIVDDEYTIIAGTGKYKSLVGQKDYEAVFPESPYLYSTVLRTGRSFIVEDADRDFIYGPNPLGEMCEICCPIILEQKTIGVIGLIAFNQQQKETMLQQKETWHSFLTHMARLLADSVIAQKSYDNLQVTNQLLSTVIESISNGIIYVDKNATIVHCNSKACAITGLPRDKLTGRHISEIWPETPVLQVLHSGKGYIDREEYYSNGRRITHLLVSSHPILLNNRPAGAVITFRDMAEVRQLAFRLTDSQYELSFAHIRGNSKAIREVKELAMQVARSSSSILITGESGTGKELFARAIHFASPRRNKPFIIVNCGAIPETLLESELFGYEEGAFTGAKKGGRPGKFELANGGTILLDEIGDLPLHLQVKLLHVLQRRQIERVGGNKIIPVDVRVIAATNRDLEAMCRSGEFREDLYYRLSVIPLQVPPLYERKEDIPELMHYFLEKYCQLLEKDIAGFSPGVIDLFSSYRWPGNVRELENSVEYAVNMERSSMITMESVPPRLLVFSRKNASHDHTIEYNLNNRIRKLEKEIFQDVLDKISSRQISIHQAPDLLGVSRATFYRKLKELGLKS